ncbi:MAG: 50S ribosomal protein L21 [Proteobacteria bacterium]|nr:50S ribosomal protein L21 [Pseudomonadota bacterium]
MYAVFRTGGKQYRAAKGDVLRLEKIEGEEGASVKFDEVLLIGEGSNIKVGNPVLAGSSVSAKVLRQGKSKKVPVVKFKRRQNYLRQGTHRQFFTEVEITGITGAAAKPPAGDKKKPAAAPTAAAKKVTKKAAPKKAPAGDKKAAPKKPPSGDKKAATKKKAAKK